MNTKTSLLLAAIVFCGQTASADLFRRGDADGNAAIDLTDAITTLGYLFFGNDAPLCPDAADSDDSGALELTDAIFTLGYVFLGTEPPPAPGPETCGIDPTEDELGVCVMSSCQPPIDPMPLELPPNDIATTVDDFANALVHEALTTIFNSPGDSVNISYGGNVAVAPWPGVPIVVELDETIAASSTDDGAHELAITQDAAGGIGVELWDGIEAQVVETQSSRVVFRFEDVEGLVSGLRSLFTRFILVPVAGQAVDIVVAFEALARTLDDALDELDAARHLEEQREAAAATTSAEVRALESELAAKRRELADELDLVGQLDRLIDEGCGIVNNPACVSWRDRLRAANRKVDALRGEISQLSARVDAARAAEIAASESLAAAASAAQLAETAADAARHAIEAARAVAESAHDVLADLDDAKLELEASFAAYELRKGVAASVEAFLSPFPGVTVEGAGIGGALAGGAGVGVRVEFEPGFQFSSLSVKAGREVEINGTAALGAGLKGQVNLSTEIEAEYTWEGLDAVFAPRIAPTLTITLDSEVRATGGLLAQFELGAGLESAIEFDLSRIPDIVEDLFGHVAERDLVGLAETVVGIEATASARGRWVGAGVIGVGASYVGYGAGIEGSATWTDVGEQATTVVSAGSLIETIWDAAHIGERLTELAAEVEAAAN